MGSNESQEEKENLQAQKDIFEQHIFDSYFNLRTGIAVLAILFPLVLLIGSKIMGEDLRDSMSAYYLVLNEKTMRDWFVGILWAIGVFLILYKGWEHKKGGGLNENWALNFAGLFAIGVAMFPTQPETNWISIHGTCAVSLFLLMAYVCIRRALDTLYVLKDIKLRKRFKRIYIVLGILMLATPITAWSFAAVLQSLQQYTFWVEAGGVWVFASYWLVKSSELSLSGMERKVPDFPVESLPENGSSKFEVEPGLLDYPTGVKVEEGEEYHFKTNEGKWIDWFIRCGPEGWGGWFPLKYFNRKRGEPFFMLCGNVDKKVDDDVLSFRIGKGSTWKVPDKVSTLEDRQLYLFANDIPIAYGNNRKHPREPLTVTITRLKRDKK